MQAIHSSRSQRQFDSQLAGNLTSPGAPVDAPSRGSPIYIELDLSSLEPRATLQDAPATALPEVPYLKPRSLTGNLRRRQLEELISDPSVSDDNRECAAHDLFLEFSEIHPPPTARPL